MVHSRYKIVLPFLALLTGCSSTPVSEQLINGAKNDLIAVDNIITGIQTNIPDECNIMVSDEIKTVSEKIKSIDEKITSSVSACKAEKSELKEKITNRNTTILILIAIIIVLCYIYMKRGKS